MLPDVPVEHVVGQYTDRSLPYFGAHLDGTGASPLQLPVYEQDAAQVVDVADLHAVAVPVLECEAGFVQRPCP